MRISRKRKQAENLIGISERNLAKSQEMAHLGSWELDLANLDDINANPLRWSDEIFRMFGYAPGEFEPSNEAFFRAVHPDDRAKLSRIMAEAVQGGKPYSVEHRIIRPDGTERIIHAQSEIIYDKKTGQPLKMVGLGQDITERKQADEALRNSEKEQRQLAERVEIERARLAEAQAMARLGSWELDLVTSELTWSDENYRIFGMNRDNFKATYEAFLERIHPDDRAKVNEAYTESVANHTPYAIDHRLQMDDGTIKFVHERCRTFYDAAGQPIRSIGTTHDITERKQAEQSLLQSEARFRTSISEAPVPIMIHREDGQVLQISKGWTEYSGYAIEDVPTIRDWVERAYGEESDGAYKVHSNTV